MLSTSRIDPIAFNKNWGLFLVWGILLVILGTLAISTSILTTVISMIFIGALLVVGGIVITIDAFTFWRRHVWSNFFLYLLIGVMYFIAGIYLIESPLAASISLTLLLGIFYNVVGVFRIITSLIGRQPKWGWNFFSGIIALLLGTMIMASWPASGLYIIGLFVGIDLLFLGWVYIIGALSARSATK
jgi:uncharacterized membrane protein HdeD (DUF308 family)